MKNLREEQKIAKTAMGSKIVYIPVIMGIPAIFEYPITSGMNMAAMTTPAMISAENLERSRGNKPSKIAPLNRDFMSFIWITPSHILQ